MKSSSKPYEPQLLSQPTAAKLIGVSIPTFRDLVEKGRLEAVKFETRAWEKHFYRREDCLRVKAELGK